MKKEFPHFINSLLKAEGGTNSVNRKCNPLRRSCVSSARNAGESAIRPVCAQPSAEIVRARNAGESAIHPVCVRPSAEIVRVERAKCRRECDLPGARATLCGDRAFRVREMQARARFVRCARDPLRRSCVSSARNAGESAALSGPRATLCGDRACRVRECRRECRSSGPRATLCGDRACAKCRRERDSSGPRATLCGDRARRVREMQARARFVKLPRNPLRRSCVSSARNAGESAIRSVRAQPSAEQRRLCSTTLVRGVAGELEDENWRLGSTALVRGVAGEWEDENWRLCSTNCSTRSSWGVGR